MNLMRQRDDLKAACDNDCINKAQLEMALASPVFQWYGGDRNMSDDEEEWLFTNVMDAMPAMLGKGEVRPDDIHPSADMRGRELTPGRVIWPRVTPYDCFRVSYLDTPVYEQWFIGAKKALCFRCDNGHSHPEVKMWSVHATNRGDPSWRMWIWINGVRMDMAKNKLRAGSIEMMANPEELSNLASSPMNWLAFFLFDVMSNSSVVVRVRPNVEGKSVQWHQAREHLLVMHHAKAQKLQQKQVGPSDKDLVRGAHWRRKHLRRLSSDKFVHKKGLLVPVKRAWVGPEEWKGNDNKIYKVVTFEPTTLT
jgi:hypothetical protein